MKRALILIICAAFVGCAPKFKEDCQELALGKALDQLKTKSKAPDGTEKLDILAHIDAKIAKDCKGFFIPPRTPAEIAKCEAESIANLEKVLETKGTPSERNAAFRRGFYAIGFETGSYYFQLLTEAEMPIEKELKCESLPEGPRAEAYKDCMKKAFDEASKKLASEGFEEPKLQKAIMEDCETKDPASVDACYELSVQRLKEALAVEGTRQERAKARRKVAEEIGSKTDLRFSLLQSEYEGNADKELKCSETFEHSKN